MGRPRIVGSLAPIQKPPSIQFDPTRGLIINNEYESAGNGLVGLANTFYAGKVAFTLKPSTHKSHLSATITSGQAGFPELVQDHWQLLANEVQKDLREHPAVLALEASSPGILALILKAVDDFNNGKTTTPSFPDGEANTVFDLMKKGQTHFAVGQYVLRWTTNVSFNSTVYRGEGNREMLYSTSQVISESLPPTAITSAMTSISAPTFVSGYFWSWRRLPSTRTTVAQNRVEVSTEYWLDQWSTYIYSPL